MLYSKNGSIPKPETDGTEGWIEVSEPPVVEEGLEVVWWYPPGWVVRRPKPAATDTTDWSWSQSQGRWVEIAKPLEVIELEIDGIDEGVSASSTITIDGVSATATITASASPSI
jgi:hypothetical protein